MKWFKYVTSYGEFPAVIMGYCTYKSLGYKLLSNRLNIILSRCDDIPLTNGLHRDEIIKSLNGTCGMHCQSISEALEFVNKCGITHLYVIGGSSVYSWFSNYLLYDDFYITHIGGDFKCNIKIDDTVNHIAENYKVCHTNKLFNNFSSKYTMDHKDITGKPHASELKVTSYYKDNLKEETAFKTLIENIMKKPLADNRTIYRTRSLMNQHLRFSLRGNVLPASTLRRQWIKGIFTELMWFIKGRTDLEYLHDRGVHIWDANCTADALSKTGANIPENSVGAIYGHQWRNFGAQWAPNDNDTTSVNCGFDQLMYVINMLKTEPTSRRIMISGWCPPDIFNNACLPPCHVSYNFNVEIINGEKRLYCHMLQRSSDVALALSWNIISASLLVHLIARVTDLVPEELSITIANAHIYENHEDGVYELLKRDPRSNPRIYIKNKRPIEEYVFEDLLIMNYTPHPHIKMGDMAV